MTAAERHQSAAAEPPAQSAPPTIAPARIYGDQLITSGQTAHIDGTNIAEGIVGDGIDLDTARRCAWQCARNVVEAARGELIKAGRDLDAITGVTRVTIFVASAPSFTDQHLVGHAATQYFLEVFGPEIGFHTRAALGLAALPTNSPVEIEAIFQLAD
ncbi:RidA family protein [Microlunatus parietis]|uniref:Enamine deaminase RidA (YjgF/YER057c/UK114 family) n=1 Tax=Microlunatus parietis TaxID=682979 RepID=A0A7Y9IE48_9ACTN|nr:RidA family protein [Microlunatus parietis]NYE75144.1 enamine deaminase RidA (YjgF/YER057c/UK114 family) [Microlunatus parietis]